MSIYMDDLFISLLQERPPDGALQTNRYSIEFRLIPQENEYYIRRSEPRFCMCPEGAVSPRRHTRSLVKYDMAILQVNQLTDHMETFG